MSYKAPLNIREERDTRPAVSDKSEVVIDFCLTPPFAELLTCIAKNY